MKRLLTIQAFIVKKLVELSIKEQSLSVEEKPLSDQDKNLQNVLSKIQELLLHKDDINGLKAALIFLQQVPIENIETVANIKSVADKPEENIGRTPSAHDLQNGLTRSLSSLQDQVVEKMSLTSSGLFHFSQFSNMVKSARSSLLSKIRSESDIAIMPKEIELKELQDCEDIEVQNLDDFLVIQKEIELTDFKNPKVNTTPGIKSFSQWIKEQGSYVKLFPKKEWHEFKQFIIDGLSKIPDSVASYNLTPEQGKYFSADGLATLESLYKLILHYHPKWTHTFKRDIDGYIAKDRISAWYKKSKAPSANHAIGDFTRNVAIDGKFAKNETESFDMIAKLVKGSNHLLDEQALLSAWMASEGGQENNVDLEVLDPQLPSYVAADSVKHNWYIEDGKICLDTNLHIKRLQRVIGVDDRGIEIYSTKLINIEGYLVEVSGDGLATQLELHNAAEKEMLPIFNLKYTIMLEVKNNNVIPRMVAAQLVSYSDNYLNPIEDEQLISEEVDIADYVESINRGFGL